MKIRLHKSHERGFADYGWLKARYSFSFAEYFDPLRERFGVLRVLNDDIIAGGGGFNTHPHNNMEIITIPLSGALEHRDSMGHTMVIKENDVQYMSAGSGVEHAELNHSATEPINLLQIWLFPQSRNTQPRYEQISLQHADRHNKIQTIVSPEGGDQIITIHQQAWLSLLDSDESKSYTYEPHHAENGIFLFVIEGEIETGLHLLQERDSAEITGAEVLKFTSKQKSRLLIIEVPQD